MFPSWYQHAPDSSPYKLAPSHMLQTCEWANSKVVPRTILNHTGNWDVRNSCRGYHGDVTPEQFLYLEHANRIRRMIKAILAKKYYCHSIDIPHWPGANMFNRVFMWGYPIVGNQLEPPRSGECFETFGLDFQIWKTGGNNNVSLLQGGRG